MVSNAGHTVYSIVVADKNETLRRVLTDTIANERIQIVEVADGQSLLESVRTQSPDLVILDSAIADPSPADTVHRLRADRRGRQLPIVLLMSGTGSDAERAVASVDHILSKPFSPVELLNLVDSLLSGGPAVTDN